MGFYMGKIITSEKVTIKGDQQNVGRTFMCDAVSGQEYHASHGTV